MICTEKCSLERGVSGIKKQSEWGVSSMARLNAVSVESATGKVKDLFHGVNSKLGMVPNMMRTMANSPAVLDGYLQLSNSLRHGALSAKVGEELALAISEENGCEYCLSAHSAIGKMLGLTTDQIRDSREGLSVDAKTDVLIRFARKVATLRGRVSNSDLSEVRQAGYDDGQIAEVVGHVALSIFTNYFNNLAETDIDFPKAPALKPELATLV